MIAVAIFDDAVVRLKLDFLSRPLPSLLLWGVVYYLWMAVIAVVTVRWKEVRMGATLTMNEGYWFAYVSAPLSCFES
jgi:hypothetical protein